MYAYMIYTSAHAYTHTHTHMHDSSPANILAVLKYTAKYYFPSPMLQTHIHTYAHVSSHMHVYMTVEQMVALAGLSDARNTIIQAQDSVSAGGKNWKKNMKMCAEKAVRKLWFMLCWASEQPTGIVRVCLSHL